jgi:D-proline reductase (dithiol) PrdB
MIAGVAHVSELPLSARVYIAAYRWRKIDPVPSAPLRRPLSESRVALVSTAGLVLPGQAPFDNDVKGGDWSWREIPDDADVATMIDSHRSQSYDHSGVQADPNLAFPLDRLHELVRDGVVGAASRRHFSLMGSITAPGRLTSETAPAVADALAADGVDAVLLVPV